MENQEQSTIQHQTILEHLENCLKVLDFIEMNDVP